MYLGYIYNNFILILFLIWFFTLFNICLCNFKLDVSSLEIVWEGAVHARNGLLDMQKSQMWQNS